MRGRMISPALCLTALFLAAAPLPVLADATIGGGARAMAMGGAGLAAGDVPGETAANPAALADAGMRLGVEMPNITARVEGAETHQARSLVGSTSLDPLAALNLAIDLGKEPTNITASASGGLLLPHMDLRTDVGINARITPNDAFKAWAQSGGIALNMVSDASADVKALGMLTLPSVGVGFYVPSPGHMAVGVRVKPVTAYYSHYIIDKEAVDTRKAKRAPEMGDQDYLKRTSFSADLGITFSPKRMRSLRLAAVVNNFVEPQRIKFDNPDADGMVDQGVSPRTVNVGAAFVTKNITLAADLVDLGSALGDPEFRAGAELRLGGIALRGGYNTQNGYTYGLGIGSFGIAVSDKAPLTLMDVISF